MGGWGVPGLKARWPGIRSTLLLTSEGLSLSHLQTGSMVPHLEGCCKDRDFLKAGASGPDFHALSTRMPNGRINDLMC